MTQARMNMQAAARKPYEALLRLSGSVDVDERIGGLIEVRASQINGCAMCIDMHWQKARAAGETEARLYGLDAWRESPFYDERERAALALCEAMTLIAGSHVPDGVWHAAKSVFSDEELGQIVFAIAVINAWNRLAITNRSEPGHYRPVATAS